VTVLLLADLHFATAQNMVEDGDFLKPLVSDTASHGWHKCQVKDSPDFFSDSLSASIFEKYRGGTRSYSGKSHVGLFVYRKADKNRSEVREFICGRITHVMKKDSFYQVKVYVKPDEESNVECDGFAVGLPSENINRRKTADMYEMVPMMVRSKGNFIPRTEEWTVISGNYKAHGNERYILLGNLKSDALTSIRPVQKTVSAKRDKWPLREGEQIAYLYIDNVSITMNDSLNRLNIKKSEEKKQKKIRDMHIRDSLKLVRDSLAKAGKKETVTEASTNTATPMVIDLLDINSGRALNLPMIQFEVNRADFKSNAILQLNELLRAMRKWPTMVIEIRGHTDNSGNTQHNLDLSIARAAAVAKFLEKNGIAANRLQTYGYGGSQPIESNNTEEGRAANRRIEVFILHE